MLLPEFDWTILARLRGLPPAEMLLTEEFDRLLRSFAAQRPDERQFDRVGPSDDPVRRLLERRLQAERRYPPLGIRQPPSRLSLGCRVRWRTRWRTGTRRKPNCPREPSSTRHPTSSRAAVSGF